MDGDVFFQGAAGGLVVGELRFRCGHVLAGRFKPRLERLLPLRLLGKATLCVAGGRVEPLQGDDAFEVSVHLSWACAGGF